MTNRRSPLDSTSLLTSLAALGFGGLLLAQIQPSFRAMLADFGAPLSLLSRVALSPTFALLAGLLPLGLAGTALSLDRQSPARAALQVAAMAIAVLLPVGFFLGAYLPVLELTSRIGAGGGP